MPAQPDADRDAREPRDLAAELPIQEQPEPDVAADDVAEASWESFPASDPPAWQDRSG